MQRHSSGAGPRAGETRRPPRSGFARTVLATVTALALMLGAIASAQAAAPNARTVRINLVTINDFHGRIEQSGTAAGIARLSTAVNSFRAENPNTLFAAAGDLIGASTFTSFIQEDVPTIDALNAAGLDVSSVGNHEFDQGFADLTDRVIPMADWAYLGANIYDAGTDDAALPEYWLKKYQGVTIGFIGAVTDELPSLVSPAGIEDISVGAPVDAANRVANQLSDGKSKNGEADIVILLVHEGSEAPDVETATDPESRFGQIVLGANDNIDAIVSGHTHLPYNLVIDGRPVISSGQYGERFSNMEISFDRSTNAVTMENTLYTMATALDASGNVTSWLYEPDPALVPIVAEATAIADEIGNVEIGTAEAPFNRAQRPGIVNGQPAIVENRGGESTLGNFVADVQLWSLNDDDQDRGVDLAFMNPGGLRTDINADGTTFREAANVQPFANTLVTLNLTGANIKAILEEQWQPAGASRPFLKLGVNEAFRYTYDPTAAAGSHITEMFLNDEPLDLAATYKVGANSFLAAGGDNFVTFRQGTNKADTGKIDLQAMVDYFLEFGSAAPDYAQRAVGVDLVSVVGDQATVALSSLDFSTTEPKSGTVTVSLDDTALVTETVDPSFPNPATFDEIGRATVTFTIPAGATADSVFVITTPASTGTVSSFTLPL